MQATAEELVKALIAHPLYREGLAREDGVSTDKLAPERCGVWIAASRLATYALQEVRRDEHGKRSARSCESSTCMQ
jgi:hypothetical protein